MPTEKVWFVFFQIEDSESRKNSRLRICFIILAADCEPQQAAVLSQIRAVKSQVDTRTYEQREEDYMKARQRIFGDSHTTTCEEDSCPKDTASVATPVHNRYATLSMYYTENSSMVEQLSINKARLTISSADF